MQSKRTNQGATRERKRDGGMKAGREEFQGRTDQQYQAPQRSQITQESQASVDMAQRSTWAPSKPLKRNHEKWAEEAVVVEQLYKKSLRIICCDGKNGGRTIA